MTVMTCIDEYINNKPIATPIYTSDIFNYVKKVVSDLNKAKFNTYMQRYEIKNPDLVRYQKGIYYKTVDTPFGKVQIDYFKVIVRKYIQDENNIYGYESGPSLMNSLGLTTQVPRLTYIVTNNIRYRYQDSQLGIKFLKPVVEVNKDNYRYLQLLDILANKEGIHIEVDYYKDIYKKFIKQFHLDFKKLFGYSYYYHNENVYEQLAELAKEISNL